MHIRIIILNFVRNFPSFKLTLESDNVGTLTRESVDPVSEASLLDDVAAEFHDPRHQAAGLLQVLTQVNTKHFLAGKLTLGHLLDWLILLV